MSRTKRTKAIIAAEENQIIGRWRVESVVPGSTRQVRVTCLSCGDCVVRCIYDLTRTRASRQQQCKKCSNKEIISKNRLPAGEALLSGEFHSYRKNAKQRGYDFQLSREDFKLLVFSECYYCGAAPARRVESSWDFIEINGVDRLDNSLSYILDNCVSCCKICNYAKRDLSQKDFIEMCRKVSGRWQ